MMVGDYSRRKRVDDVILCVTTFLRNLVDAVSNIFGDRRSYLWRTRRRSSVPRLLFFEDAMAFLPFRAQKRSSG